MQSDSSETVDGSIEIGDDTLTGYTFSTSSTTTEAITTTAASGTTLDIQATSRDISDSSIKQLEVQ